MKKNYIAPNTEMLNFTSMGLMQDNIAFATNAASGGAGGTTMQTIDDVNLID